MNQEAKKELKNKTDFALKEIKKNSIKIINLSFEKVSTNRLFLKYLEKLLLLQINEQNIKQGDLFKTKKVLVLCLPNKGFLKIKENEYFIIGRLKILLTKNENALHGLNMIFDVIYNTKKHELYVSDVIRSMQDDKIIIVNANRFNKKV